jgi:hypothetical protein
MAVWAEGADGHALAVSRMKISSRTTANSAAATQIPPMRVRLTTWWTGAGCAGAWFAGAAASGAAGWVPPAGCYVMDRTPHQVMSHLPFRLLRLNGARQGGRVCQRVAGRLGKWRGSLGLSGGG